MPIFFSPQVESINYDEHYISEATKHRRLVLHPDLVEVISRGVILILNWALPDDITKHFRPAHKNAHVWHRDIALGISAIYKQAWIVRDIGTDFTITDGTMYDFQQPRLSPTLEHIHTIKWDSPESKLVLASQRIFPVKINGMIEERVLVHRKSQEQDVWENPLLFYGTFRAQDGNRLYINSDFS